MRKHEVGFVGFQSVANISRLWVTTCQVMLFEKLKRRPPVASCAYFARDRPQFMTLVWLL